MGKKRDFIGAYAEEKKVKEQAPIEEVKEEKIEAEVIKEETAEAVIDGVEMALNIRKDPEIKNNNQIAILAKGTKIIVVDPEKPVKNKDGEWFKVRLKKDADPKDPASNGYAIKRYIKIISI